MWSVTRGSYYVSARCRDLYCQGFSLPASGYYCRVHWQPDGVVRLGRLRILRAHLAAQFFPSHVAFVSLLLTFCAFLVEYAPFMRRAFIGSWQQVSVGTGTILGSAIAALLTGVMPQGALYSWGWRIPFLLGGLIGLYALYLRRSVKDTPAFERL